MDGLINQMKRFNAKERHHLINAALGDPLLDQGFVATLTDASGFDVPTTAWWAMDFHLDWLESAVRCAGTATGIFMGNVNTNQQDVDLIIGYDDGPITRLVLVEAKGVTSHRNRQFTSKMSRLVSFFGHDGHSHAGVALRFLLASPARPRKLALDGVPQWALNDGLVRWMPLRLPTGLEMPSRCTPDGTPSKTGTAWKIVQRKYKGASAQRAR